MNAIRFSLSVVFLLAVITKTSFAQSGCLVAGNNVYTTPETSLVNAILALIIGPGFKGSPIPSTSSCINGTTTAYIPNNALNCRVCPTSTGFTISGVVAVCSVATIDGKIANPTIIQCNIDDYTWAMAAGIGVFGLIIIRRKKTF